MKNKKLGWAKPSWSWIVWFFPVIAVGITVWLAMDYLRDRGPLVQLKFSDASSVEAQKTPVRFRGTNVGKVERVELAEDNKEVYVYIRLTRAARQLAVQGSRFWIVQPEVGFEGVRGLETILRGPYIRVEPGSGKELVKEFRGHLGEPGVKRAGTDYRIRTDMADSIDVGDPVSFRGMKVGIVQSVDLDKNGHGIDVEVRIHKQYTHLIRNNTVFWRKSGVDADLGLFGAKVKIGSLESLMKGGVAFATPTQADPQAKAGTVFGMVNEPPKEWQKWRPNL